MGTARVASLDREAVCPMFESGICVNSVVITPAVSCNVTSRMGVRPYVRFVQKEVEIRVQTLDPIMISSGKDDLNVDGASCGGETRSFTTIH